MINLMPPAMKEQIRYAKLNRMVLHYLWGLVVAIVVLAGVFGGAFYLINQESRATAQQVKDKQDQIASIKKTFLPAAQDASERLNAIKYVQDTQTRFSALIADLSQVFPQGVSIDSFTLTGNDKQAVDIVVSAQTYDQILALRNALVTSPRVANADIQAITAQTTAPNYQFKGTLVIGFKPGQAK